MFTQEQAEYQAQYARTLFDAIPSPAFIVDEDVRILDFNQAATQLLGDDPPTALYRRGGEALRCIHSQFLGCGKNPACHDCVIRRSVGKALAGINTCREPHQMQLRSPGGTIRLDVLVTASLLPYSDPPRVLIIVEDRQYVLPSRRTRPRARHHQQCRD